MPQKRSTPAVCQYCSAFFVALDNSKAKYCSNACVGRASVRPVAVRFYELVDKTHTDWMWNGAVMPELANGEGGYGKFSFAKNDPRLAHRVAWELASGVPIPDGMMVLHTCDIRRCVRNDESGIYILSGRELPRYGHLFLGTHDDNMLDAQLKGKLRGGANHREPRRYLKSA